MRTKQAKSRTEIKKKKRKKSSVSEVTLNGHWASVYCPVQVTGPPLMLLNTDRF